MGLARIKTTEWLCKIPQISRALSTVAPSHTFFGGILNHVAFSVKCVGPEFEHACTIIGLNDFKQIEAQHRINKDDYYRIITALRTKKTNTWLLLLPNDGNDDQQYAIDSILGGAIRERHVFQEGKIQLFTTCEKMKRTELKKLIAPNVSYDPPSRVYGYIEHMSCLEARRLCQALKQHRQKEEEPAGTAEQPFSDPYYNRKTRYFKSMTMSTDTLCKIIKHPDIQVALYDLEAEVVMIKVMASTTIGEIQGCAGVYTWKPVSRLHYKTFRNRISTKHIVCNTYYGKEYVSRVDFQTMRQRKMVPRKRKRRGFTYKAEDEPCKTRRTARFWYAPPEIDLQLIEGILGGLDKLAWIKKHKQIGLVFKTRKPTKKYILDPIQPISAHAARMCSSTPLF